MDMDITQHFQASEFRCKDGTDYPAEWVQDRLTPLCSMLEVIREAAGGRSITVICGYRTPNYNASLAAAGHNVAASSFHMQGQAADIAAEGMAASDLHALIHLLYAQGRLPLLGGLGVYPGWCHVDIRQRPADGHLARWDCT